MKKWLKILLSLNSLRKALGAANFSQAIQFNHHIEIIEDLNPPAGGKNVLVLAPHADDDCFGCGGTIKKLVNAGAKVTVVYFCDGVGGVKEAGGRNNDLISIRKKEAEGAGQILGVAKQIFLSYPDGRLAAGFAATKILRDLITKLRPDTIFLPSFIDNHPDHLAVNDIFIETTKMIKIRAEVWAYEVWTPIFANRIILINQEIETKKAAMATQKSQLAARSYDKAILGLNQYRAEINNRQGFAEAFFATTPDIYQKLYNQTKT